MGLEPVFLVYEFDVLESFTVRRFRGAFFMDWFGKKFRNVFYSFVFDQKSKVCKLRKYSLAKYTVICNVSVRRERKKNVKLNVNLGNCT